MTPTAEGRASFLGRASFFPPESLIDHMSCKALTVYLREGVGLALLLAASLLGMEPSAAAADVSVYTSGAAVAVQKTIAANFTTSTGHRILFTTGTLREIQ